MVVGLWVLPPRGHVGEPVAAEGTGRTFSVSGPARAIEWFGPLHGLCGRHVRELFCVAPLVGGGIGASLSTVLSVSSLDGPVIDCTYLAFMEWCAVTCGSGDALRMTMGGGVHHARSSPLWCLCVYRLSYRFCRGEALLFSLPFPVATSAILRSR